jgi:lipopolysaccharide biosynthesis protein
MITTSQCRLIAFYLPQFHPIPENDEWWGKGFTEWTNVAKAKPLFRGHYQPHVPADLGFYDLRVGETRVAQAEMAREHGIEGFCYYHYWFAGRRLLERPFNEVLKNGDPNFPFCLCWANQTWSGVWHGRPNETLIEQTYPGFADHREHFEALVKAFEDPRYIRVKDRPLFMIYQPWEIPSVEKVLDFWNELSVARGLSCPYFVGILFGDEQPPTNFDAFVATRLGPPSAVRSGGNGMAGRLSRAFLKMIGRPRPKIYRYSDYVEEMFSEPPHDYFNYPCVVPNWDNTPRSGARGVVLHGSTPELFRVHLRKAINSVREREMEFRLVFVKSWNEWAEGNHLEPDLKFGRQFLEVTKQEVME